MWKHKNFINLQLYAPQAGWCTINFDSHIKKIIATSPQWDTSYTWTTSGEMQPPSYDSHMAVANNQLVTFEVTLDAGYVLDTVTLTEGGGETVDSQTDTSFVIKNGTGVLGSPITLTSKPKTVKNYIISSSELTAIADATRTKADITTKLIPAQIAEKINNLTIVADIDTADKMTALLVAENEGNVYKYVGTTTTDYINGDLYVVEKINSGYTVSYTNSANSAAPAEVKINGGQWTTVTEASGTFENVQTIQFYAGRDQGNYAATIKSTTLGLNMSGNDVATSEVYTLTQNITDVKISWEPYREQLG